MEDSNTPKPEEVSDASEPKEGGQAPQAEEQPAPEPAAASDTSAGKPAEEQPAPEPAAASQASAEEPAAEPPMDYPLPPPSFEFLVFSLRSQAEMHLGLLSYGDQDEDVKPNLKLAQHAIDLMALLLEKTKGNLSIDEHRLLENSVTELRYRFVQVSDSLKQG